MHLPDNTLLQRGKYRIIHYINGGGFGYTYEAEHVMLHKRVAIKEFFYKKETLRNADNSISIPSKNMERNLIPIKKKFIEEAIFLSQANHPNIISVTDVFEENETAYYVMDYIDGKSLSQILKEQGTLTETQAVDYICQVTEALKYVHSFNRLHLDIKPDNILVDSHSGRAILIDFGTCKHYDENSGEQTTGLLGMQTDGYAPIELANKTFSNFSPSTDVYELGATLYCLLSGFKPPIAASLSSGDEVIKPLPSHISANTRHAVECSLKLRRNDRPQNMDEFMLILRGGHTNESKGTSVDDEVTYFEQDTPQTHLLQLNTSLQGGKYKIVRHLSSGGFGNTYEALHAMQQTRIAIKEFYVRDLNKRDGQTNNVILSSQNHQEIVDRLRHMFKEEARVGYQMKHKHIIPVIDIFEENNTIYYAMEYIDGRDLSDIIRTHGPLPESKVLGIINQVADALKYIHSHKRLHLNVKPSNIIINIEGKAFLSVSGANEMYEGIHTVGYSPLEQITQKYSSWSPATDIYALGATTYKLLTGITPPNSVDLVLQEETLQPLPASVSPSTCHAVRKAMMLVNNYRLQSIDEFVSLLNSTSTSSNSIVTDDEETRIDMPHVDEKDKDKNELPYIPSFLKGVSLLLCNSSQFFFWRDGRIYQVEEKKLSRDIEFRLISQNIDVVSFCNENISSCIIVYDDNQTSILNLKRKDFFQYLPSQRLIEERTAVGMGHLYKNISFEGILTVSYQNKYTVMDCDAGVYEVIANDIPINKMGALLSDYDGRKNVEVFSSGYEHLKNVIRGTLLQHQILNSKNHENVVLLDVFPHSVDLLLMEKSMVRDYRNLLPKDSSIPVKRALLLPVSSQNELCLSINSENFYIPYKINNRIDSIEIVLDITSNHDISIEIKDSCTKYSHKFSFLDIVNSEETQLL